jgi:SPP1 family predicted phage head-tail adaptor
MRAGALKHKITFHAPVKTKGSMGAAVKTFSGTPTLRARAALWPASAKELIRNGKEGMDITHQIRMRYRSEVVHDMQIRFGSRFFNIKSILNKDEANRQLDILAKEEV